MSNNKASETPTPWLNIGARVMVDGSVAKPKRVRFASLEETSPPPSPSPSTPKTATMSSLFGNLGANNKPAGTGGLFGAAGSAPASTQSSTPSLFGTAPTGATGTGASSGSIFGGQQQQNNKPTLSLFGNNTGTSNAAAQPATSAPSLFGNTSNAIQQPATTAPSLFGGATATGGSNLFGSTASAQPAANTLGGNNQGKTPNIFSCQGSPLTLA